MITAKTLLTIVRATRLMSDDGIKRMFRRCPRLRRRLRRLALLAGQLVTMNEQGEFPMPVNEVAGLQHLLDLDRLTLASTAQVLALAHGGRRNR